MAGAMVLTTTAALTRRAGRSKALGAADVLLRHDLTIIQVTADWVTVRLAGPYGATILYTASMLRPVPDGY
jgi:hypothetical protein